MNAFDYVMLIIGVVALPAVFALRKKSPGKMILGFTLCLVTPTWGQFYVKSKRSGWYMGVFAGLFVARYKIGLTPEQMTIYLIALSLVSAFVMALRIRTATSSATQSGDNAALLLISKGNSSNKALIIICAVVVCFVFIYAGYRMSSANETAKKGNNFSDGVYQCFLDNLPDTRVDENVNMVLAMCGTYDGKSYNSKNSFGLFGPKDVQGCWFKYGKNVTDQRVMSIIIDSCQALYPGKKQANSKSYQQTQVQTAPNQ